MVSVSRLHLIDGLARFLLRMAIGREFVSRS